MTELECLNEFREQAKLVEKPEKFLNFGYDCLSHLETKPDRLERLMGMNFIMTVTDGMIRIEAPIAPDEMDDLFCGSLTDLDTFLDEQEKK